MLPTGTAMSDRTLAALPPSSLGIVLPNDAMRGGNGDLVLLPEWDYDASVAQTGGLIRHWKGTTGAILLELWQAREQLSQPGRPWGRKTWGGYCKDIGLPQSTANRWLQVLTCPSEQVIEEAPTLPEGRFATIVADPPWAYRDALPQKQGAISNYSCLTVPEICELAIPYVAADDAHLYLWVTTGMIQEGYEVVRAWGFIFKSFLTWHKTGRMGLGRWFRNDTEHVIFAVRGDLKLKRKDARNIFRAPARSHSEKPEEFIALVETCSPGPYLELFSRKIRPGWETWGNEVGKIPTQLGLSA